MIPDELDTHFARQLAEEINCFINPIEMLLDKAEALFTDKTPALNSAVKRDFPVVLITRFYCLCRALPVKFDILKDNYMPSISFTTQKELMISKFRFGNEALLATNQLREQWKKDKRNLLADLVPLKACLVQIRRSIYPDKAKLARVESFILKFYHYYPDILEFGQGYADDFFKTLESETAGYLQANPIKDYEAQLHKHIIDLPRKVAFIHEGIRHFVTADRNVKDNVIECKARKLLTKMKLSENIQNTLLYYFSQQDLAYLIYLRVFKVLMKNGISLKGGDLSGFAHLSQRKEIQSISTNDETYAVFTMTIPFTQMRMIDKNDAMDGINYGYLKETKDTSPILSLSYSFKISQTELSCDDSSFVYISSDSEEDMANINIPTVDFSGVNVELINIRLESKHPVFTKPLKELKWPTVQNDSIDTMTL